MDLSLSEVVTFITSNYFLEIRKLHLRFQNVLYQIRKRRRKVLCKMNKLKFYLLHFPLEHFQLQLPPELLYTGIRYRRKVWMLKRSNGLWKNVIMKEYTESEWIESFRMSKASFLSICKILESNLKPKENAPKSRIPLSVENQVAIALYKLASCAEYRVVGNVFGVHKSTVKKCLYKVTIAIIENMVGTMISMPDRDEAKYISLAFEKMSHIPQIIGSIDGTHIPITAPEKGYRDYVNRKGWASYNVQAIVDYNGRFRNITVKHPGSPHDAAVFKDSAVYKEASTIIPQEKRNINGLDVPYLIVGDPAYSLLQWLIKAYPGTLEAKEESFNVYLNSARVVVEMAFRRLKARWRILLKRMECDYKFSPRIILTCCILHNFVESKKEKFYVHWLNEVYAAEEINPQPTCEVSRHRNDMSATIIRNHLKEYMAANFPLKKSLLIRH